MRLFSLLLLCCITSGLFAQKNPATKTSATKNIQPAGEKIKPVTDSVPLTESLVFAKLGKTKVTAHYLKTFPSPQLNRNKEVLYFLYGHFDEKQVQRIITLAESRTMATSAGYDSVKKRGDAFTAYLVKPYRHIWPSDSTKYTEMALLYIPYSEKENFSDLYTIQPATTEGRFVSADYTALETETMAKLPPVPKWEQKSLFTLPNYKATHKEEPVAVVVQPTAPAAANVTSSNKNSEVQYAKTQLNTYISHLSAAVKSYAKLSEAINGVDNSCWENSKTNSRAATLSYNSYNAWYAALDELKQAYAALEKLNTTRFAPFCKEWASIEIKISEAKSAMGAFINTERATGIVKRLQDEGKAGSWADIWFQTVKELVSYRDGKIKPGFNDFVMSSQKINDLAKQCGN